MTVSLDCLYLGFRGGLYIVCLKLGFISAGMKEHQVFVNLSFMLMFQFVNDRDSSDHVKCLPVIHLEETKLNKLN